LRAIGQHLSQLDKALALVVLRVALGGWGEGEPSPAGDREMNDA
jgi:hypothetical protein